MIPDSIKDEHREPDAKETIHYALLGADGKEETLIKKEVWSKYIGKNATLVLKANSYRWKIECEDLTENNIHNLDMGVVFGETKIPEEVLKQNLDERALYSTLSLAHNGLFYFTAYLEYEVDSSLIGKTAKLYYYDGTRLQYQKECKIGEDGIVRFPFDHASEYIVVYDTGVGNNKAEAVEDSTKKSSGMKNATKIRVMIIGFAVAFLLSLGGGIFCLVKYYMEKKKVIDEGVSSTTDEA